MSRDDFQQAVQAARGIQPKWGEDRLQQARQGVDRLQRRRRRLRVAGAVGLVGAPLLLAWILIWPPWAPDVGTPSVVVRPSVVQFSDGSRALPGDPNGLVLQQSTPEEIRLTLESGVSRFEVTPRKRRRFVVDAGQVRVTVLGTKFSVERRRGSVRVAVERGLVRVDSPAGTWKLGAGQNAVFPDEGDPVGPSGEPVRGAEAAGSKPDSPGQVTASAVEATTPAKGLGGKAPTRAGRDDVPEGRKVLPKERKVDEDSLSSKSLPQAAPSWRSLATQGKLREAADLLGETPPSQIRGAQDLLRAADVLRRAGRPAKAMPYLLLVEERHPSTSAASLAVFQRGRIALLQLGKPCSAAPLFIKARKRAGRASLRQDALAREAEAWFKCGRKDLAKARAKEYLLRYPTGHHRNAVLRYGGEL